jgi:peptide/nickel transport system permease protein
MSDDARKIDPAAGALDRRYRAGIAWRRFVRHRPGLLGAVILAVLVIIAVFAGVLAPYDPIAQNLPDALMPPSAAHWFGTDEFGRDILSRVLAGSRIALIIGVVTVAASLLVGVFLGLDAGYYRGVAGELIMRSMDILLAFPYLLLALMVVAILGPGLTKAMIAVGILNVPQFARLVQGLTTSYRERQFVEAARAYGAPAPRILVRHLLATMWGPVIAQATLTVGASITAAAGLGVLGLGAQPPTPEWGAMLSTGRNYMLTAPWVATFPGLAILVTVIGFNLFGQGLLDVFAGGSRGRR